MYSFLLFYCSVCLHLFNLGFQDPKLASQRDSTCKYCLFRLLNEPEINAYRILNYTEEVTHPNDLSFDYRLLPLFRKTIEEKIQFACDWKPIGPEVHYIPGAMTLKDYAIEDMVGEFTNVIKEVYLYEKDIKAFLEEQKQEVLKKLAQKIEDITLASQKLGDLGELTKRTKMGIDFEWKEAEERMKKMEIIMRRKEEEVKSLFEVLVTNKTINNMRKYSELISDFYTKYEAFKNDQTMEVNNKYLKSWENSLRNLKEEFAERKMPKKYPEFERILSKLEYGLQELPEVIDELFYHGWSGLEERVEQRIEQYNWDL